jgi:hypothetical protein
MQPRRIFVLGAALVLVTSAAFAQVTFAQVTPARDTIVATQLLPRSVKASLRKQANDALTPAQRLAQAQRMIEAGRASGDPRTLGYAEALLAPWPADSADAPLQALVLRATIEGSRHRFEAARQLLDRVLAREPAHAQALLTRATIGQVTGDYAAARADCMALRAFSADVAAICNAGVDALTGHNERALGMLAIAIERTSKDQNNRGLHGWALALQAQLFEARGEARAADTAYRAALASADDLVTRLAYVDLLLARQQIAAAAELLQDAPETDGVLLRQWLIARAQGSDAAGSLAERLQARIAAATARGALVHAREAALFALERGDAAEALQRAQENWRAQREPADLWLLARAARAAGDGAALEQARAWTQRTGLVDARIARALQGEVR